MRQQLTHLCENIAGCNSELMQRGQAEICETARRGEARERQREWDPVHVRASTRTSYAVGFTSTYLLPTCGASAVLSCRRERVCINAKRSPESRRTVDPPLCERIFIYRNRNAGTSATRSRAHARAYVRVCLAAWLMVERYFLRTRACRIWRFLQLVAWEIYIYKLLLIL